MPFVKFVIALLALVGLGGCLNSVEDDLRPSGRDQRVTVAPDSIGVQPGQRAPDFTLSDTQAKLFHLADHLSGGSQPADAIVLYFTMWCPICLSHTDHLYNEIVPRFAGHGTVVYGLVDYVSGSVESARMMEQSNGYADSAFTVLVDAQLEVFKRYKGAMGKVVVIDKEGTVVMNEDYRNGERLAAALENLLP